MGSHMDPFRAQTHIWEKYVALEDIIISYGDIIYKENVLIKLINNIDNLSTIVDVKWLNYWKKRMGIRFNVL